MASSSIQIETSDYVAAHGHEPRGTGTGQWWVEILSDLYCYSGPYSRAIKFAKKDARIQYNAKLGPHYSPKVKILP